LAVSRIGGRDIHRSLGVKLSALEYVVRSGTRIPSQVAWCTMLCGSDISHNGECTLRLNDYHVAMTGRERDVVRQSCEATWRFRTCSTGVTKMMLRINATAIGQAYI
jgi:hypothetical protein